jgi:hypothetical protein
MTGAEDEKPTPEAVLSGDEGEAASLSDVPQNHVTIAFFDRDEVEEFIKAWDRAGAILMAILIVIIVIIACSLHFTSCGACISVSHLERLLPEGLSCAEVMESRRNSRVCHVGKKEIENNIDVKAYCGCGKEESLNECTIPCVDEMIEGTMTPSGKEPITSDQCSEATIVPPYVTNPRYCETMISECCPLMILSTFVINEGSNECIVCEDGYLLLENKTLDNYQGKSTKLYFFRFGFKALDDPHTMT